MAPGDLKRLREAYDAWNRREVDRIPEFFHPDAVFRPSGIFPDFDADYSGHERIAEFWRTVTEPFEYMRIELQEAEERGDEIVAMVRFVARGADSGADVALDFVHHVKFEDGLITEFRAVPRDDEDRGAVGP